LPVILDDTIETLLREVSSEAPATVTKPVRPLQAATPDARPVISILVPCNGSGNGLLHALDSIAEARSELYQQLGKRSELIVAGYGAAHDSLLYAEEFDGRIVAKGLLTLSAAVNAGAAEARGEFLVLVEPDLIPRKNCLCLIMEALSTENSLGGGTAIRHAKKNPVTLLGFFLSQLPLRLNGLTLGVFFVRKCTFDELGGFKDSALSAQLLEFAVRLKRHALATGRRVSNVRKICAVRQGNGHLTLSAREWLRLLLLPLLWHP
jgi:hypothetical protein